MSANQSWMLNFLSNTQYYVYLIHANAND